MSKFILFEALTKMVKTRISVQDIYWRNYSLTSSQVWSPKTLPSGAGIDSHVDSAQRSDADADSRFRCYWGTLVPIEELDTWWTKPRSTPGNHNGCLVYQLFGTCFCVEEHGQRGHVHLPFLPETWNRERIEWHEEFSRYGPMKQVQHTDQSASVMRCSRLSSFSKRSPLLSRRA